MTYVDWIVFGLGVGAMIGTGIWFARRRLHQAVLHAIHEFHARLARYKRLPRRISRLKGMGYAQLKQEGGLAV